MELEKTRKAYNEILKAIKKYKDVCVFDVQELEANSKLHLLGLELKETYGLNIEPKSVRSFSWIDCGEHLKIGWFSEKENRTISWSDDDRQPNDEMLVCLKFPTGPYIFGDGNLFTKDYPIAFFQKFWVELVSFNPDYSDSHNKCLYWKLENAKEIFNSFNDILKRYYDLNKEDVKQRRIEKMKEDLAKLENQ